jgi:hypothetical protein
MKETSQTKKTFFKEKINKHSEHVHIGEFHSSIHEQLKKIIHVTKIQAKQSKSQLDEPSSKDEIFNAVKTLKGGKSTASNLISNEMLRYGIKHLIESLLKLLNLIFEIRYSPKLWNESYFIHKKCSKTSPSNYRDISLTSNTCVQENCSIKLYWQE